MRTMKRVAILLTMCLLAALPCTGRVVERTFLTTDRDVYVAGDNVWISAFCTDASTGRLSGVSSVAYVELHSADGAVQELKIALRRGRGAGCMTLLASLPTGNYRLVAYTAQNKAEKGYDYEGVASKTISVFNVLSKERVKNGVTVLTPEEYSGVQKEGFSKACGGIGISIPEERPQEGFLPVHISNNGAAGALFSVSIYNEDGIRHPANPGPSEFVSRLRDVKAGEIPTDFVPEFEGEMIRGRIAGASPAILDSLKGRYAFIAAPGDGYDIYASGIADDGSLLFHTGNIYGMRDLVCEIEGVDSTSACHIELEDPFVRAEVPAPELLSISESLAPALKERSMSMQIERRFMSDTLFSWFRVKGSSLVGPDPIRYNLEDYRRFPLMKEVFSEIIHEIRIAGNSRRGRTFSIGLMDSHKRSVPSAHETLVLLDGVPVFNHDKLYNYDPLLVKYIDIYPYPYLVGTKFYDGVISFVTYKGNMPTMTFDGNVRIVGFKGASFPQAYTCSFLSPGDAYPDYRRTIYWNPLVEVPSGGSFAASVKLPDYKGDFTVVVEGFDSDGRPVCAKSSFSVR